MPRTNRRKNLHHLGWPRAQHSGIQKVARELPCMKVMLDVEVHALLHRLYGVPRIIPVEDAKHLIARHQAEVCGCYDRSGNVESNILYINFREEDDDGTGSPDRQLRLL